MRLFAALHGPCLCRRLHKDRRTHKTRHFPCEYYRKLFKDIKGVDLPMLTRGIQFHINSQKNTRSNAEISICDVYFSRN